MSLKCHSCKTGIDEEKKPFVVCSCFQARFCSMKCVNSSNGLERHWKECMMAKQPVQQQPNESDSILLLAPGGRRVGGGSQRPRVPVPTQNVPRIKGTSDKLKTISREVKKLKIGEEYWISRYVRTDDNFPRINLSYTRISQSEHQEAMEKRDKLVKSGEKVWAKFKGSTPKYGNVCPDCGKNLLMASQNLMYDSWCAEVYDRLVCEDPSCGVCRLCSMEGAEAC